MDSFTAGILLSAAMQGTPNDKVADLYKDLKGPASGLDPRVVDKAEGMKGTRVAINHTSYKGTVLGANRAVGGFYGGERYPVRVAIDETNSGSTGEVFEYGFDDLTVLEETTT